VELVKKLLLLFLRKHLLFLLHYYWWKDRFYFCIITSIVKRCPKIVNRPRLILIWDKTSLHEIDRGQCWRLKDGHHSSMFRWDLGWAFYVIWCVILMVLRMIWERCGINLTIVYSQRFKLLLPVILRAELVAHLSLILVCTNSHIWYVCQPPLRRFAALPHRL